MTLIFSFYVYLQSVCVIIKTYDVVGNGCDPSELCCDPLGF